MELEVLRSAATWREFKVTHTLKASETNGDLHSEHIVKTFKHPYPVNVVRFDPYTEMTRDYMRTLRTPDSDDILGRIKLVHLSFDTSNPKDLTMTLVFKLTMFSPWDDIDFLERSTLTLVDFSEYFKDLRYFTPVVIGLSYDEYVPSVVLKQKSIA